MSVTKKYMVENYLNLERKTALLDLYLFDTQNNRKPDATETQYDNVHGSIRGQLFRAAGATGGYVVIFYIPRVGETGNTQIAYLDDMNRDLRENHSEHTLPLRIVLERLMIARDKAANQAKGVA